MKVVLFILSVIFCLPQVYSQNSKYLLEVVKESTSIEHYSRIYNAPSDSIKKWNNMNLDTLPAGFTLKIYNISNLSKKDIAINKENEKLRKISLDSQNVTSWYNIELKKLNDLKNSVDETSPYAMQEFFNISKSKHSLNNMQDSLLNEIAKQEQDVRANIKRLEQVNQVDIANINKKDNILITEEKVNITLNDSLPKKTKPKSKQDKRKKKKEDNTIEEKENDEYDLTSLEFDTRVKKDTISKKYKRSQDKLSKKITLQESNDDVELKNVIVGEVEVNAKRNIKRYKLGEEVDAVRKDKAKFFLTRAMVEIDKQNLKKANAYVDKSLNLNPSYTEAYMLKGDILASVGYYDKALKEYERASITNGNIAQVYYNMGNCYIYLNKQRKAIEMMSLALDVDADYILAYAGRSSLYIENKEYQKALDDYNSLLAINKYFYPALKGRGMAYLELSEYKNAVKDFNKLLSYEDKDASIYYYRGLAKLYQNETYGACMDFLKSSERGYNEANKAIRKYCD